MNRDVAARVVELCARGVDVHAVEVQRLTKIGLPHLQRAARLHAQLEHAQRSARGTQRGKMPLVNVKIVARLVHGAVASLPCRDEALEVVGKAVGCHRRAEDEQRRDHRNHATHAAASLAPAVQSPTLKTKRYKTGKDQSQRDLSLLLSLHYVVHLARCPLLKNFHLGVGDVTCQITLHCPHIPGDRAAYVVRNGQGILHFGPSVAYEAGMCAV